MRALLINPTTKSVEQIDLPENESLLHDHVHALLECEHFTTITTMQKNVSLLINEQAIIRMDYRAFLYKHASIMMYGPALLVGKEVVTGQITTLSDTITPTSVHQDLFFLTQAESDFSRPVPLEDFDSNQA